MFVSFFIKRPILASIFAVATVIAGLLAIKFMPLTEYPNITPPEVSVSAYYTGADALTVESGATSPLEQAINGGSGIDCIQSWSSNDGSSYINVKYHEGQDLDLAASEVRTRIQPVLDHMPQNIKDHVSVSKSSRDAMVMYIPITTERYSKEFISSYVNRLIVPALQRIPGVSRVFINGDRRYAMRIWLDPYRLAALGVTPTNVYNAIGNQNIQSVGGIIGQPPISPDQSFQLSIKTAGQLRNKSEFDEIVVDTVKGSTVKLKDVARVELGAEDYSSEVLYNGKDAVMIDVEERADANDIRISDEANKILKRLARNLPEGMKVEVGLDTTDSVRKSIQEVLETLVQAIVLVVLVIFVFLEDWRSTVIPVLTIPISLIGTFWFMNLFGFSINVLTLFGITLATGLVVDDAIVVIENVIRYSEEKNLNAKDATAPAMAEVFRAILGITLVLCAVFIPVGFFHGTAGQLYKQFALTICVSMGISAFNSLTLTPALSALWLKGNRRRPNILLAPVNLLIEFLRNIYKVSLHLALKVWPISLLAFGVCLYGSYYLFKTVPSSFIPNEDRGYFYLSIQPPQGVAQKYSDDLLRTVEKTVAEIPEVRSQIGFFGSGSDGSFVYVTLKPWDDRREKKSSVDAVIERVRERFKNFAAGSVSVFNPPPVNGLASSGNFTFELQDLNNESVSKLAELANKFAKTADKTQGLTAVSAGSSQTAPQIYIVVDKEKAADLGVAINDIYDTIRLLLNPTYINDFVLGNRLCPVYMQAEKDFRSNPEQIGQYYAKSTSGNLVQLKNFIKTQRVSSVSAVNHFDLLRSISISGSPASEVSSGTAIAIMENLANKTLPQGISYSWSGISREEIASSQQTILIFSLSILSVFLVVAAQYENLLDPLVVILPLPLAIMGALAAQQMRGLHNDIFCQIGLVLLVGLSSKNSILIVEFANRLRSEGESLRSAILTAAVIRWRPILMTSLALVMGILPLTMSTGAGAAARQSLGTAVCGGMIASTILSIYFVPVIYLIVHGSYNFLFKRKAKIEASATVPVINPFEMPDNERAEEDSIASQAPEQRS